MIAAQRKITDRQQCRSDDLVAVGDMGYGKEDAGDMPLQGQVIEFIGRSSGLIGNGMRFSKSTVKKFKRFTDWTAEVPEEARLMILVRPNGCGNSSFFDALQNWHRYYSKRGELSDYEYYNKTATITSSWGYHTGSERLLAKGTGVVE